jgi:hypothetical protein
VPLSHGYTAVLWVSRHPTPDDIPRMQQLHPVVQLAENGRAVQWWNAPVENALAWGGSLTCLTTGPEDNCVLDGGAGAHAGYAVAMVLRDGGLVSGPNASVVGDSLGTAVADLNADGYLDVAAVVSDFSPSYATGHFYWRTFRFKGDAFVPTGCVPRTTAPRQPAPSHLVYGACP